MVDNVETIDNGQLKVGDWEFIIDNGQWIVDSG